MRRLFPILLLCSLLAACASGPGDRAAPVESRGAEAPASTGDNGVQVLAYRPPEPLPAEVVARSQPSRAVQVLLRRADDQQRSGDYSAAAASLERGLRIEPRNPRIWNRLAHLNADQGQYARVEQLAAKSNALVQDDRDLRADNWALIARARESLGDAGGAQRARQRAAQNR